MSAKQRRVALQHPDPRRHYWPDPVHYSRPSRVVGHLVRAPEESTVQVAVRLNDDSEKGAPKSLMAATQHPRRRILS
eukprot:8281412-Pyramimonas_sp.AAC.1